ncbi:phosphoesterase [Nocardioides sp. MAH-18]|uniref:Phosphoesterase n=1 Tax=Nocardioides agri TaxID=2682843 RepID=A0A6L6XPW7_9ACTN|nr:MULTISPECIES: alkaline phosphatase family protein [unclassified Nocardioides]MBA2953771.1 phosphoesterase [Nocardioides sp. CGMCC 1.13656]MVQ48636.1 phosphoesterase [Nocardioides sp. MAH-18]
MSRPYRVAAVAVTIATTVALSSGCSSARIPEGNQGASPQPARVTKLLVFVVENHSLRQMRYGMPWLSRLATRYGYATGYRAITHPSLPNYLGIAGGDTFGVTDDAPPSAHPINAPSVFGSAVRAGRTATIYAEGMDTRCQRVNGGRYAVRHNPWTYFRSERRMCRRHDMPLTALSGDVTAGDLPQVGMVIPDVCNDAHDCSLARADEWLRDQVGKALRGPDFTSRHLAIVVTADEDDGYHGNRVLTVVAHPQLHHVTVRRPLSHYSLSRSYAEVANIEPLAHAAGSRSLLRAFGLH